MFYSSIWAHKYYRFLAEAWLARRDDGFWSFHKKGLATVGDAIDRGQLLREAARVVIGHALSPGRLGAALLRRARDRSCPG